MFQSGKKDWLIKMSGFAWSPDKLSSVCLWCENMERPATNTNESPSPFSLSWFFSPVFQTFQHTWMACVVCRCLARLSPHIACDSCSPWINDSRCSWSENLTLGNTSQHITRPFSLFESAPSTIISSEPFMERSFSLIPEVEDGLQISPWDCIRRSHP